VIIASVFSGWGGDLPDLLHGLVVALELTGLSLLIGFPGGLLTALMVSSRNRAAGLLGLAIVEVGRGLPLLVLLYIVYQGLPQVHLSLTNFLSAVAAFAWSTAAYSSEMFRASLNALPKGQREAALATGMGQVDTFRFVLLPQALRIAIPPLLNLAVQIFQATSLAYVITVPEIMQHAYFIGTVSFLYLNVFLLAGLLYAAVTLPSSALIARLERRLSRHTSV
jgi:polar amino acid transport system permease protein